jgi:CDP-glucose 4,6-dehydratase
VRPWQHVADALDGYLRVAERALSGDASVARAWNFAPLDPGSLTVEQLAIALRRELRSDVPIVAEAAVEPHEAAMLALDASDAAAYLGWTPRRDVAAAIAATGAWFREFFGGAPAADLIEADLESRAPA